MTDLQNDLGVLIPDTIVSWPIGPHVIIYLRPTDNLVHLVQFPLIIGYIVWRIEFYLSTLMSAMCFGVGQDFFYVKEQE